MKLERKVKANVRLSPEQRRALRAQAHRSGTSVSEQVRRAADLYLQMDFKDLEAIAMRRPN